MAQSNPAPALDKNVEELHTNLVALLSGEGAVGTPDEPYWDASSTKLQDDFKRRVAKLLKTYADQPAPPGGDSQAAANKTSG